MTTSPVQESERATRKRRIDPKLRASGWDIVPFDPQKPISTYRHHAIEEYPTANGPADYALVVSGKLVGVVEAKKVTLGPQNVLTQAERYSQGIEGGQLDFDGYRAPFLYSTNGEIFWFHDARERLNRSRQVSGFHTPAALAEMLMREFDSGCGWLRAHASQHPA